MSQLKDVYHVYHSLQQSGELFGWDDGAQQESVERFRAIGKTLTDELGIPLELGSKLIQDTELTPKAEQLFLELQIWAGLKKVT